VSSNTLRRSFAGGEIGPELHGRLDLTRYQTGLALAQNALILPHGPAQRRPGMRFISEAKRSSRRVRLIPFEFSADQSAAIEFGHEYVRFLVGGGLLLEANRDVQSVAGSTVIMSPAHGWSTGDDVFIGGRFVRITVTSSAAFTMADLWGNPVTFDGPINQLAARVYTLPTPYQEEHLFGLVYAQDNDVLTLTHPDYPARELRRLGASSWELTTISFAPPLPPPIGMSLVATSPTSGNPIRQTYKITSVNADGVTESLPSIEISVDNDLTIAGNFNTLSWVDDPDAARTYIYKQRGGSFGFIGQTTGLSIVDDNILPDTTRAPPEDIIRLNDATNRYPSAVAYLEQRRWFAGTRGGPQAVWATRSGTDANLTSSIPSQDDDAFQFRLASQKQNAIRFLIALNDLVALTVGGSFRIFSNGAPAIVPSALSLKPQGATGVAQVQPVVTDASILFVQASGAHVREMAYNDQRLGFVSLDVSLFAPHLFDGFELVDMAFARASVPVLWCVRSDGVLLGMTYVPEHQVYAWHRHPTDGRVESVCAVSEGREDGVYFVVRRDIDGRTVRYLERLSNRFYTYAEDSFFVDCGVTYPGPFPQSAISGLWHLEGKTVQILANGGTHPPRQVVNGSVELEAPASLVHVGLPFVTRIQTLPVASEAAPAGGQGMTKNVNEVAIRVTNSNTIKAGPSFDNLTSWPSRDVLDLVGVAEPLRSEELRFPIQPDWNDDGQVCIQQDLPLPLTVLSIALDVAAGG
jgi:hypothetical protein